MKTKLKVYDYFYPIATFIIVLVIWQFTVTANDIPRYILPTPSEIIMVFKNDYSNLISNSIITLTEAFFGFLIAIGVSLIIGVLMDLFPFFKKCFYPLMLVTQMIPTITIAPLMMIWFGFGIMPKILLVQLTCFFPILISFVDGMENIDKDYINLFKTMKASKSDLFIHLKFPMSLEELFSGLKISSTYAMMAATVAEWLGGTAGLGVYMVRAKTSYALDKVFASTILVVIYSLVFVGIIFLLKKLIFRRRLSNNEI